MCFRTSKIFLNLNNIQGPKGNKIEVKEAEYSFYIQG